MMGIYSTAPFVFMHCGWVLLHYTVSFVTIDFLYLWIDSDGGSSLRFTVEPF